MRCPSLPQAWAEGHVLPRSATKDKEVTAVEKESGRRNMGSVYDWDKKALLRGFCGRESKTAVRLKSHRGNGTDAILGAIARFLSNIQLKQAYGIHGASRKGPSFGLFAPNFASWQA
jgi:hypothetical protein